MTRRAVVRLVIALMLGTPLVALAIKPKVNMREGLWRIDIEMTLPGAGPDAGGPQFRDICLSAANLQQSMLPITEFCVPTVTKQESGVMDWTMRCTQGSSNTVSRAHFEFKGEQMAGAILTTAPRFNMEFRTIVRGKYLGACPTGTATTRAQQQNPQIHERPVAPLAPYKP